MADVVQYKFADTNKLDVYTIQKLVEKLMISAAAFREQIETFVCKKTAAQIFIKNTDKSLIRVSDVCACWIN